VIYYGKKNKESKNGLFSPSLTFYQVQEVEEPVRRM